MLIVGLAAVKEWAAPAATVAAALIAGLAAWYAQAWKRRRDARDRSAQLLREYRDPILSAAYDLQSRMYNIVLLGFLGRYWSGGNRDERAYALSSTLWLVGQYLGWVEIVRREVQFLDLGSEERNRALQWHFGRVADELATDAISGNGAFITYRGEQRAIGEFMVAQREGEETTRLLCMDYSPFVQEVNAALSEEAKRAGSSGALLQPPFAAWVARFARDFALAGEAKSGTGRLIAVQRRLIDLIDHLDPDRVRYPDVDTRGRLPATTPDGPSPFRLARFKLSPGEPWDRVDHWATNHQFKQTQKDRAEAVADTREYRRPSLRPSPVIVIEYRDRSVEIRGWMSRRRGPAPIDGGPGARRAKLAANELLAAFDRPLLLVRRRRWTVNRRSPAKAHATLMQEPRARK